jgi:hypothetical protein
MSNNESAFPIIENRYGYDGEVLGIECTKPGMTLKEYAAIRLKVPRSGNEEIDGMIRESVRRGFAEKAVAGLLAGGILRDETSEGYATRAYGLADAMLAEWEKETKQ